MPEFLRVPTRSLGLKFLLVCALAGLMAIPTLAVWGVQHDRLNRYNEVRNEISRYEGGSQTVMGPLFLVPYTKQVENTNAEGKREIVTLRGEAVVFAETGQADAQLAMEKRKRAIYTIPVYKAQIALTATFDPANAARTLATLDPAAQFDWSKARIAMGVSNTIGLLSDIVIDLGNGQGRQLQPTTIQVPNQPGNNGYNNGYSLVAASIGDLVATPSGPLTAKTSFTLSGAERFAIAAFAKSTTAKIASSWPDPSFEGFVLPLGRQVSAQGFTANWNAGLVRRGLPEAATDTNILNEVANKDFAVRFTESTNIYTGVDRALKYSIMFIGLVFLAYFMFEVVSGARAHPAQYIMIGLAQAIFYLLLLAFAERLGFTIAFVIAAAATVALISLYVQVVFKKRLYVIPAFLTFTVVYALMYVLMQMEDYALLVGSLMSFAALAALMYLTRNVAWYGAADDREKGSTS